MNDKPELNRFFGAGQAAPTMESEARDGMRKIFKMGILHAAFMLRGGDFGDMPDEHVDRMATFIEQQSLGISGPAPWPLPKDRSDSYDDAMAAKCLSNPKT